MGRRLVASSSEVGGTQRDGNASSRGISGHPEVGGCWARTDGETDAKSTIATTLKDRRFIEFTPPINFAVRLKGGPFAPNDRGASYEYTMRSGSGGWPILRRSRRCR